MIWRVAAFLRFRGWRNLYWLEDWYVSRCAHREPWWWQEYQAFCSSCGGAVACTQEVRVR